MPHRPRGTCARGDGSDGSAGAERRPVDRTRWVRPHGPDRVGLTPWARLLGLTPWAASRRPRAATYVPGAHSSTIRVADWKALRPPIDTGPRPAEIIRPHRTGADRLKPT